MMYYVNWVLTNAQIDLIAADVSVVDYGSFDRSPKRKRGEFDNSSADADDVKRAGAAWLEKYGGENGTGGVIQVKDILGGMKMGSGIKLK